jgi:hypothetical protein
MMLAPDWFAVSPAKEHSEQSRFRRRPERRKVSMRFRNLFAISLFALILTAAAFADSVKVDYDHSTNFNQLKTYSWKTVNTANSLWDKRVKDAVDSELAAKG